MFSKTTIAYPVLPSAALRDTATRTPYDASLTTNAFAAWALYLTFCSFGRLPNVHGHHSTKPILRKAAFGAPAVIGPIMYVEAEMRMVTGVMTR